MGALAPLSMRTGGSGTQEEVSRVERPFDAFRPDDVAVAAPSAGVKRRERMMRTSGGLLRRLTRRRRAQLDGDEVVLGARPRGTAPASIKWRERARFGTTDATVLAAHRAAVPGATAAELVAVSRTGIQPGADLDMSFGPDDLLDAWGSASRG